MYKHRATCEEPGCGRFWRENCIDCVEDVAQAHRDATGHPVHLTLTPDDVTMRELNRMTRTARMVLIRSKRGR